MNITVEENERIKITMTAEELSLNGITFAELDYDTEKSRLFLQKLFYCSKSVTNFSKKGESLIIEIFPAANRGCTVYFTPIGEIKQEKTSVKLNTPKICTLTAVFKGSDELLDFAATIKNRKILIKHSSLYKNSDGYILVLTPFSTDLNEVRGLISEFSLAPEKNETPSFIKEQYEAVCERDALTKLTMFL